MYERISAKSVPLSSGRGTRNSAIFRAIAGPLLHMARARKSGEARCLYLSRAGPMRASLLPTA